jgi:hypothetical protein
LDRIINKIHTGLARLRAINSAAEAERDPGAQLN